MASKLSSGYFTSFVDGQGAGASTYITYAQDLDTNFTLIQASVNALVDEVAGTLGPNAVLPLDLITTESTSSFRMGDHSYVTTTDSVDQITVTGGSIVVEDVRYTKSGNTVLDATGQPDGTLYVALETSGAVTLQSSAGQGSTAIDLASVTWASGGPTLSALTLLIGIAPDGDDFQDCLTVAGTDAIPTETHEKIADRLENIERLLGGLEANVTGGSDLGPIVVPGGAAGDPGLVFGDGAGTVDLTTGLYRPNSGQIMFALGGSNRWLFNGSTVAAQSTGSAGGILFGRTGDGFYWPTNSCAIATNGADALIANGSSIVELPNQPGGELSDGSVQNLSDGTLTAIDFDTEDSGDPQGQHDTSTNPSRITITGSDEAGLYLFVGEVTFDESSGGASAGKTVVALRVDGTTEIARQTGAGNGSGSADDPSLQVSRLVEVAAGSYVELMAEQNSGGAMDITDQRLQWIRVS